MKKILFLATGGTIASQQGECGLTPQIQGEQLIQIVPKIREICEPFSDNVKNSDGSNMNLDSSNVQPEDWVLIATTIYEKLADYDGIVITHGTDTMAYTASMLSFMLSSLNKPIVFTGSQLPIEEIGTDAKSNILDAARVAVRGYSGVYIVFNGKIIIGCKASKIHTTEFSAFKSINSPLAGGIVGDDVFMNYHLHEGVDDTLLNTRICHEVFLLKLTPGINPKIIDTLISANYKGIVIEAFGLGGIPNVGRDLLEPIKRAINAGLSIVVMTQCRYGKTDLNEYEVGKRALEAGVIPVSNMTVEATITKLMWLLGQGYSSERIRNAMHMNYCGEMSVF